MRCGTINWCAKGRGSSEDAVLILAILAAAVALTLAAKHNAGYVLLVYSPYRIELSLTFL